MRIDKIQLKDFRKFENATFSFHPEFNLLVGENGSGKTSVLEALAVAFKALAWEFRERLEWHLPRNHFSFNVNMSPASPSQIAYNRMVIARQDQRFIDQRFSYEIILAAETFVHAEAKKFKLTCSQNDQFECWNTQDGDVYFPQKKDDLIFPCFVYYDISRARKLEEQATSMNVPLSKDGYTDCWTGEFSDRLLKEWFLNREVTAAQEGPIPELETVRSAIVKAIPDCQTVRFQASLNSLVIEMQNDEILPFNYLSDGYRNMLAVVADIAHRMARLNPHLGDDVLQETPGIVLIDELDLHLHPKWQRDIVDNLRKIFPKVQFIATTHSPQIISHVKPECIRILRDDEEEFYTPDLSYGLTSDAILAKIMDVEPRPEEISKKFDSLFEKIERHEFDEAKELVKNLKKEIISDPQILEAEHLIKWKERK